MVRRVLVRRFCALLLLHHTLCAVSEDVYSPTCTFYYPADIIRPVHMCNASHDRSTSLKNYSPSLPPTANTSCQHTLSQVPRLRQLVHDLLLPPLHPRLAPRCFCGVPILHAHSRTNHPPPNSAFAPDWLGRRDLAIFGFNRGQRGSVGRYAARNNGRRSLVGGSGCCVFIGARAPGHARSFREGVCAPGDKHVVWRSRNSFIGRMHRCYMRGVRGVS